jgi:hypothetical protein
LSEKRTVAKRKADVLAALEAQGDMWLSSADSAGRPHLIAVSAWWDGTDVVVATRSSTRTAANLVSGGIAKLGAGSPADVVMIDARLIETTLAENAPEVAVGFSSAVGWDPRDEGAGWAFFRLRPTRIQAYRGYEELEGRDVMRNSRWMA